MGPKEGRNQFNRLGSIQLPRHMKLLDFCVVVLPITAFGFDRSHTHGEHLLEMVHGMIGKFRFDASRVAFMVLMIPPPRFMMSI